MKLISERFEFLFVLFNFYFNNLIFLGVFILSDFTRCCRWHHLNYECAGCASPAAVVPVVTGPVVVSTQSQSNEY